MTEYELYPNLPPEDPQVAYHLSLIQAKMQGLKNKEQMFKQKIREVHENIKLTYVAKRLLKWNKRSHWNI